MRFWLQICLLIVAFLLVNCSTESSNDIDDTQVSVVQSGPTLEDIFNAPGAEAIAKAVYERDGLEDAAVAAMSGTGSSNGKAAFSAKGFYDLCRYGQAYQRDDMDVRSVFQDIERYEELSDDRKSQVETLIVGAGADGYGCGTVMQIGFWLEETVKSLEKEGLKVCLSDAPETYGRDAFMRVQSWHYEIVFHQYLDDHPKLVTYQIGVSAIIDQSLRERFLCEAMP